MGFGGFAPFGGMAPFGGVAALGASGGLPVITWNGKSISLPDPLTTCNYTTPGERMVNRSTGLSETLTVRTDVVVELTVKSFTFDQYDLQRRIRQWWEWAKAGNPWTFARYENYASLTTLASAAAAGSTSLTLTDASGVVIGGQYVLRNDVYLQIVKASDVVGNVVTLDESVDFSFAVGATFRDEWYWPGFIDREKYPVSEDAPVLWDLPLQFVEARN